jgi:hypothetical protein
MPHFLQLGSDHFSKQIGKIRAGVEVARLAHTVLCGRIIPLPGVVKRHLHKITKG